MSIEHMGMQLISYYLGDFRQLHSQSYLENDLITLENPSPKKSCVYLLLGCKFVMQNIAVLGCNTAHKPPLKSSAKIKKNKTKNHINSPHAVTRIQMNFCITRLGRNFRGFCGAE